MFPLERAYNIVSLVVMLIYENRDPTVRIGVQLVGVGEKRSGVRDAQRGGLSTLRPFNHLFHLHPF